MGRGDIMAINDPANDRYNPPPTNTPDFEKFSFGELEVDELFWQTNQPGDNIPWRKANQTQGTNLKTQTIHNFKSNTTVFQKV